MLAPIKTTFHEKAVSNFRRGKWRPFEFRCFIQCVAAHALRRHRRDNRVSCGASPMIAIPTSVTVSGTASNTIQPMLTESINCM